MSLFARDVVPSTVVNDQDQGAVVTIAAAFGLVTVVIFLNIRLLIRWPWQSLFGIDDAAAAVASVSHDSQKNSSINHTTLTLVTGIRRDTHHRCALRSSHRLGQKECTLNTAKLIACPESWCDIPEP